MLRTGVEERAAGPQPASDRAASRWRRCAGGGGGSSLDASGPIPTPKIVGSSDESRLIQVSFELQLVTGALTGGASPPGQLLGARLKGGGAAREAAAATWPPWPKAQSEVSVL